MSEYSSGISPNVKKAAKGLAKAFLVSIAIILLTYWLADKYYGVGIETDGRRFVSFVDSVFAGVIAFALLGAFTFLASVKRPEEDAIDERVSYLYSARRGGGARANKYLKDQVLLLGATISRAQNEFKIVQVSEDKKFLKIVSVIEMHVENMMKHDRYHQLMPLRISMDPLPGLDDSLGMVHYVRTSAGVGEGAFKSAVDVKGLPFFFSDGAVEYLTNIELDIPAAGSLKYEYLYECWNKSDDHHYCGANRFAEKFEVHVHNYTDEQIEISAFDCGRRKCRVVSDAITLKPRTSCKLEFDGLSPEEDVAMRIRLC